MAAALGEDAQGLPVGQVRFEADAARKTALIGVSVDAALRGLGLGAELLREAVSFWAARMPGYTAVAEVLPENPASRRLFEAAGFRLADVQRAECHTFELRPAPKEDK